MLYNTKVKSAYLKQIDLSNMIQPRNNNERFFHSSKYNNEVLLGDICIKMT